MVDPFTRNKINSKSITFSISGVDGTNENTPGRGRKTGVDLPGYESNEWCKLSKAERSELQVCRKTNEGKAKTQSDYAKKFGRNKRKGNRGNSKSNKKLRAELSAL